jgi:uncharacterized phage infection (PIP) family protein YhgE
MADDMMGQDSSGAATKSDVQRVKTDVQSVKTDVQSVKTDVQSVKTDVSWLKSGFGELKEGQRRILVVLAQVVGTLAEMKENYATKAEVRELRSEVLTRMDGFAGSLEDFKRQWAYQSDGLMLHEARLDDHDRRLGKVESRPQ